MFKTLRFVGILCAALAFGLTMAHVLERPGKARLSGAEWLTVQHTFYGGFAVVGGVAEIAGLLTSLGALPFIRRDRVATLLTWLAALSFAGMLLSYAVGNRPVNDQVAAWSAGSPPADWMTARDRWDNAHAVSTVCAATALVSLLVAVLRNRSQT
ncbi:MAG TPA: hypothetical protein VFD32_18905 [Dehalococcoidia bacterium]|nr:hypothetical protein [Dehalococcoidia bacterium]